MSTNMAASGDVQSSEGPGARAPTFFDAIFAFVVGIFEPVFQFLATHILPSEPRQHNNQNRDRSSDDTNKGQHLDNTDHADQQQEQNGDHDGESEAMQGQRMATTTRPQHPYGPKDANLDDRSSMKVAPATANGHVTQNASVSGKATKPALGDVTNSINHQRYDPTGDKETHENSQDNLTLPPAVQPLEGPEDPAQAAEREIHFGFMEEALDMVRCPLLFQDLASFIILYPFSFVLLSFPFFALLTGTLLQVVYTLCSDDTVSIMSKSISKVLFEMHGIVTSSGVPHALALLRFKAVRHVTKSSFPALGLVLRYMCAPGLQSKLSFCIRLR